MESFYTRRGRSASFPAALVTLIRSFSPTARTTPDEARTRRRSAPAEGSPAYAQVRANEERDVTVSAIEPRRAQPRRPIEDPSAGSVAEMGSCPYLYTFRDAIDSDSSRGYPPCSVSPLPTLFKEHLMAAAETKPDPIDPIDPTNCPTCRSGFQPIEPWYEEAITP